MSSCRILIILIFVIFGTALGCNPSVTKASGTKAPKKICSGQLIFEDNFNSVDKSKWKFENTLAGGGNWEFQWYPGYDSKNAFSKNGKLHIAPTTTASIYGEQYLKTARVVIPPDQCTWSANYGCDRTGHPDHIINPIRSAKMDTSDSFSFKYGKMEIRAKLPAGDWLWPALWMMPKKSTYGGWPRSGEIDLMESRGNRDLNAWNNKIGVQHVGSTLHFGPSPDHNGFMSATYGKDSSGYDKGFHLYKVVWTTNKIQFYVDNGLIGTVDAGELSAFRY
jgi:beta-glucanase (GH16 family)